MDRNFENDQTIPRKSFNKLLDAKIYAGKFPKSFIFSYEVQLGGIRQYLVIDLDQFWSIYRRLEVRHHYEVITYPSKSKLYLDLEYGKQLNPQKDGYIMVQRLLQCINSYLRSEYHCSSDLRDVVILEASTKSKFSIHVIYSKIVFGTNLDIKFFVKGLIKSFNLEERLLFSCVGKDDRKCLFIDQKVYDRSRNFRLLLSSKFGKSNHFKTSKMMFQNNEKNLPQENELYKIFCSSLVTNIPEDAKVIRLKSETNSAIIRNEVDKEDTLLLSLSPFPEIEEVIEKCLVYPGRIIKCQYRGNAYFYQIGGSRFCQIAKRSHSKNNIYFHFNVSTCELKQRCHSVHCQGCSVKIPTPNLDWLNMDPWDLII